MKPARPDGSRALPANVLVVEDDPIIALDFEQTILSFGVKRVRTANNVARALKLIGDNAPDFALLDIALARENSLLVADKLAALKIPFVFVTGYGDQVILPPPFAGRVRLPKPCSTEAKGLSD